MAVLLRRLGCCQQWLLELRIIAHRSNLQRYSQASDGKGETKDQKSLNVAVIGVPNVGKSTFINNLINHRVCPTSSKVHTTRKAYKAIYTTGQTQIVLFDTPGLVTPVNIKKHKLEQSFQSAYRHAIQHADMIAVLHDVSIGRTRNQLHPTVLEALRTYSKMPSILVVNKVDALKSKRTTLDVIRALTGSSLRASGKSPTSRWMMQAKRKEQQQSQSPTEDDGRQQSEGSWSQFNEVFLVSALTGHGIDDVHNYILKSAQQRPWSYPGNIFTDNSPESLIVDSVRARLLDYLPQEIPYNLQTFLEYYNVDNDTIYASVEIVCATKRIERLICGQSNGRLRQITERVTSDLVEMFSKPISFTIATRPRTKEKQQEVMAG